MLTRKDAALLAGGTLAGADGQILRVVTDSRTAGEGDLFVALKGERFDAHDFVADVVARGACALVRDDFVLDGAPLIRVADTRLALGRLAAGWAARQGARRVGITGSNGKTTVKEMVAAVLRHVAGSDAVLATAGNFNNDIGLPLTLLSIRPAHRFAVLEMGMNHAGELTYLASLARPEAALVNNAMRAHIGHFGSVEAIAHAKAEIFSGLADTGTAIVNADDAHAALFASAAGDRPRLAFGLGEGADVTARSVLLAADACRFVLVTPQGEAEVKLSAAGEHNVRNALAAAALCVALGLEPGQIAAGLATFGGVKGRLQLTQAACGARLIDDTYNANTDSMKAAVRVLAAYPAPRFFVMGDIGELGEGAPALHAEVGAAAREAGIEHFYTLGELARHAAAAFGEGAASFDDVDALTTELEKALTKDATVLVKGSRFMRMERVVAALA
ncbi:UDP-N-acetylmuramoyl-tripeptide--D-alanyl-D-alanine ligase [Crenobacter intestini]|uniref:UDP-N-acetylmuramoyl-tripeptide--D-alanyl-D-alanine ligase n=1 Tax=Crenobacter intestini TaxID=2563443 RepID=A0A4T0V361_9NEIS|nr:UDP-N-acetylmuramoyl-tripeptide--D-alanyl-D-alanine ligase [Crenobacter intestini]TIC86072.1 UDP-N-acetylmuramoyl-tripeptide--D-alanyl-D-alanine ligase [Crenobacter intestini]